MMDNEEVLCVASQYEQKFYLNEMFNNIPQSVKDELKIMCVLFVEEVGGIIKLYFDEEDGRLLIETEHDEGDFMYDDIGAALKVKKLQNEKAELFESLEMFYKVFLGKFEE
jgi:hypothetical protein